MIRVRILTGGVVVNYDNSDKGRIFCALRDVTEALTEYQFRKDWRTQKVTRETKAKFYIHNEKLREYRFHYAHSGMIRNALMTESMKPHVQVERLEPMGVQPIEIEYTATHKMPRKRQPEYIDFMTDTSQHIRILPASPGSGKTLCSIFAISRLKVKTAIILLPSLFDNWVDNFEELTSLKRDDILCISGSEDLCAYMEMLRRGEDSYPIVIFSTNTMQNFISDYDGENYPMSPEELFIEGSFGIKLVDEAHKWLHFHALLDMYSHIHLHMFLTGTLMSESPFIAKMENTLFREKDRCPVDPPTNHLRMHTYNYGFLNGNAPSSQGAMGYNHTKLEGNIFKNARQKRGYMSMLAEIFYHDYYKTKKDGERALIFFGKVDFVVEFAAALQDRFEDLKVVTYLAGDSESKYDDADVIVSTTKKSGTGTDISNLVYVLQTIMVSSKGENFQNMLRLRERSDGNTTFSYIWCRDIFKHGQYHKKRLNDLRPLYHSLENRTVNKLI